MADGSGGCRHVVETINLLHLVAEGAAHDQPHHEFNRFGAGVTQVFERWNAGEAFGIAGEPVEEGLVEFPVHEAGARALDLMRHPTGAEDNDLEILLPALDGFLDRLAQHEATMAGWGGVLDHIYSQWNNPAGPRFGLPEEQRHRCRQAVIDLHFINDSHVELIEHKRLKHV